MNIKAGSRFAVVFLSVLCVFPLQSFAGESEKIAGQSREILGRAQVEAEESLGGRWVVLRMLYEKLEALREERTGQEYKVIRMSLGVVQSAATVKSMAIQFESVNTIHGHQPNGEFYYKDPAGMSNEDIIQAAREGKLVRHVYSMGKTHAEALIAAVQNLDLEIFKLEQIRNRIEEVKKDIERLRIKPNKAGK